MPGKFIVLEGPDGAGTSTHSEVLAKRLQAEGFDVLRTAEPTAGPIGTAIRGYLTSGTVRGLPLQLLFSADRAWHLEHEVSPALAAGKIVISDRYALSTITYTGAQGLDVSQVQQLNAGFLIPDCTVLTLPSLQVALDRLQKRSQADLFEKAEFQKTLHEHYRNETLWNPHTHVVDTGGTKESVAEVIYQIVKKYL